MVQKSDTRTVFCCKNRRFVHGQRRAPYVGRKVDMYPDGML